MKSLSQFVAYLAMLALLSLPPWLALRYSDVSFAFISVMGMLFTLNMSTAFVLSAQKSGIRKYKEIDIS